MPSKKKKIHLKLSPNVRMRMTVQQEMKLDPDGEIFNEQLHERYLGKHREAAEKQLALSKSWLYSNMALAILLFGKDFKLPVVGMNLSDIPAAIQVITFVSSISFLFMSFAFLNAQLYEAIAQQFDIRKASKLGVDADFLSAANIYTELWLKAFSREMHHGGLDFFKAPGSYAAYYGIIQFIGIFAVFSVLGLHLVGIGYSLWFTWENKIWWWVFASAIMSMNLGALLGNLLISFSFAIDSEGPPIDD